jgi:hypothetical protein
MWVDHDWGLRYYLESEGALAVPRGQAFAVGDVVVSKQPHPEGQRIASLEIRPSIPLRLFSLNEKSAYSVASAGLWPFEFSTAPVDRVAAYLIGERKAELTWVTPKDQQQILRGLDPDGWSSSDATVLVKHGDGPLTAEFTIHAQSPARHIRLLVDGQQVAEKTFAEPGSYALSAPAPGGGSSITVTLAVDKTFSVPGDGRQLGILVTGIGFKP